MNSSISSRLQARRLTSRRPSFQPIQSIRRAVTVLDIHAADHGFARALRARATRWWGIPPASVHPMFTTPHTKSSAPSGAVVHDLCYRPLGTHPRGFDIILLNEALLLANTAHDEESGIENPPHSRRTRCDISRLSSLRLIRPGNLASLCSVVARSSSLSQ